MKQKLLSSFFVAISSLPITSADWLLQSANTTTTICFGVGAGSRNVDIAATTNQGNGTVQAIAELYSNGTWTGFPINSASGVLVDAAVSLDSSLKVGSSFLYAIFIANNNTTDGGGFVQASNLGGTIQDVNIFGNNNIGLVGGIVFKKKSYNGVAVSFDKGSSFQAYNIPSGYAKYGSFVDEQTWFVSAGTYGNTTTSASSGSESEFVTVPGIFPTDTVKPLSRKIRFKQSVGYVDSPSPAADTDTTTDGNDNTTSYPNENGWLASISDHGRRTNMD